VGESTALGTSIANSDGLTFAWDFGDGTQAQGPAPSHVFTSLGFPHVAVKVSNAQGDSVSGSADVPVGSRELVGGPDCTKPDGTGWCWQNKIVTGWPLAAATYAAGAPLVMVGGHGTILASVDSGQTWMQPASGVSNDLTDVAFRDATHGFAVGRFGSAALTSDGGNTWAAFNVDPDAEFAPHVVAFDESQIVVNYHLESTSVSHDGGKTFVRSPMDMVDFVAGRDCWSLYANNSASVSADCTGNPVPRVSLPAFAAGFKAGGAAPGGAHIVLLGEDSVGFHSFVSDDNGLTFTSYPQRDYVYWWPHDLVVTDATHVWALADYVYQSVDGGRTFGDPIVGPEPPLDPRMDGLVDGTAWPYYIDAEKITLTQDLVHWAVMPNPEAGIYFYAIDTRVLRWDGQASLVLEIDDRFYATSDAGAHWSRILGPDASSGAGWGFAIGFADALHGTTVSSTGFLETTSDGGLTWTRSSLGGAAASPALHFTTSRTGWMLSGYQAWQTTDAGATWSPSAAAGIVSSPQDMAWPDALHGWLLGSSVVGVTQDGGATWATVSLGSILGPDDSVRHLAAESATNAVLVTYHSGDSWISSYFQVWTTFDGGLTWRAGPSSAYDLSVSHGGSNTFWLGSEDVAHLLQKSTDGGLTWTPIEDPLLSSLGCRVWGGADDDHAWVLLIDWPYDRMLATADGGTTWHDVQAPILESTQFADLAAVDPSTLWLVTYEGVVAATVTGGL
jgi:photosystem II stability/assembly factor-like uncharacterized protein